MDIYRYRCTPYPLEFVPHTSTWWIQSLHPVLRFKEKSRVYERHFLTIEPQSGDVGVGVPGRSGRKKGDSLKAAILRRRFRRPTFKDPVGGLHLRCAYAPSSPASGGDGGGLGSAAGRGPALDDLGRLTGLAGLDVDLGLAVPGNGTLRWIRIRSCAVLHAAISPARALACSGESLGGSPLTCRLALNEQMAS